MSYVDGIFERYWEERTAACAPCSMGLSPREVQERSPRSWGDLRQLFCLEVNQAVEALEARERRIVWWRHPPPGTPPMAWRRIARELGLSHPIPQRIYRRAARRLAEEFRQRKLRPRPRPRAADEKELSFRE
ncbi:MAG: hypothetical protein ACE5JS_04520 [Nitrospinota bacterium]